MRWLYSRELLEKGGIPLETYDQLTPRRIDRIIKLQEQRMEERQKAIAKQREEQERKANAAQRKNVNGKRPKY